MTDTQNPAMMTAQITRWHGLLEPYGECETTSWGNLFDEFSRVRPFLGKERHPGWSAALFENDQRGKDNVQAVTAAVLDYDGGADIAEALASWGGNFGLLHTSKSHTVEAPRFRVVLPLSRPVSAFEWEILWSRLSEHAKGAPDANAKDSSRFWYEPGIPDDGAFWSTRLEGPMLDPDVWLRKAPKAAPAVYVAPARAPRQVGNGPSAEERASKYVAKMPHAISGQNGHGATWKVAITCARGFSLSFEETLRILQEHNGCCEPRWTEGELRHKALDAVEKAEVPLGYLLERRPPGWREPTSYFREPGQPVPVDEDGVVIEPEASECEDPQAEPEPEKRAVRSLSELFADVVQQAESGQRAVGVSCCHFKLDHMLAGFRPQMITVMGARTSFGKSSYAIMVADEAMRRGEQVLFITAEDSERTYAQRFMARRAKVSAFKLRANTCTPPELSRMRAQLEIAEKAPFFVDMIGKSAEDIAAIIRAQHKVSPVNLVVVDYLQRIGATKRTQDKRTEVTHVMSCISDAIKESNAAGLILSQLKRLEGGKDREPQMSDLKESGDIENMAEHIVLGWLTEEGGDEFTPATRKRFLKVEKNKDGPVDTRAIDIAFDEPTASFRVTKGEVLPSVAEEYDEAMDTEDWRNK